MGSSQHKLPVRQEDFDPPDNRDDGGGGVELERVGVSLLTLVPEDVDAAVAACHLPEGGHAAPHLWEAQPGEALQQGVVAHQRVALGHDKNQVLVGGGVHAAGKGEHVGLDVALLRGRVKALDKP